MDKLKNYIDDPLNFNIHTERKIKMIFVTGSFVTIMTSQFKMKVEVLGVW